ncbi:MAG: hypothetical protein ACLT8C_00505 [Akkermansia muciniphila]
MSTPRLLEVSGLSKSFGPLKAVNNASFVIRQGQVVGLIDPGAKYPHAHAGHAENA